MFTEGSSIKKSNFMKRCVSLKKKRFENDLFDLDLAYISKKVIAMGYPSIGYESMYRNSR
jgi:phosphatidylinositol-3,4,5-trisphosphate 3-phosphatase/dual-specificity protein phosphatase PTEN